MARARRSRIPYTGVLAIFGSRLINNRPPLVFEDGLQRRDFVHVRDVAQTVQLAYGTERGIGRAYNVGSGQSRTILSIAEDSRASAANPTSRRMSPANTASATSATASLTLRSRRANSATRRPSISPTA